MNNPYSPPKSSLDQELPEKKKRSLTFLILLNLSLWPNLAGFLSITFAYYETWFGVGLSGLFLVFSQLSIIPIFLACIFLVFNKPVGIRLVWQVVISLIVLYAIFKHVVIYDWDDLGAKFYYSIYGVLIYGFALYYAFGSGDMWARHVAFRRENS